MEALHRMGGIAKFGLVAGGYVIACLVASGVVYAYQRLTQNAFSQASAGMYAFGDLILYVCVCGGLALLPTALAVFFLLRRSQIP